MDRGDALNMPIAASHHRSGVPTLWAPKEALSYLCDLSFADFMDAAGDHGFLLIRVPDESGPLSAMLSATSTLGYARDAGAAVGQMDFRTTLADTDSLDLSQSPGAGPASLDRETAVVASLADAQIHVSALKKRGDGGAFLNKITVGRTRNHDLVLRDPSVSKFHAAFEVAESGQLTVRDMGSKNLTRLNGEPVTRPVSITAGDKLTFGSVEALFCSSNALWRLLQGSRA